MTTPYDVIIKPVISEKSMDDARLKKYTFKVATSANKTQVKHAIEDIFGVQVERVNIMNVKGKKKRVGKNVGFRANSKKAIIKLTEKSKEIEFFEGL